MKFSFFCRIAPLCLAALLVLSACAPSAEDITPSDGEISDLSPCHEAFTPQPVLAETDETDYRAMALATFEGVTATPASDFIYEVTDDGVRLISYHGADTTVVIPDAIEGKSVVALGNGCFQNNTTLTALSIPTGVTSIGTDLLTGCRSIQVLQLPQLGHERDSDGFLSYFFGATTPIGTGFRVPSSLDTVILSDTVTALPDRAFSECSKLHMVLLPDTLESIGSYAFSDCSQLHFIPLPSSLQTLGKMAFAGCAELQVVTLPSSLQYIGIGAYAGCSRLQQLTLPFLGERRESEGYIGYLFGAEHYMWNASHLPTRLQLITLTDGDIPDYAFYGCDHLALITLPNNCTSIGIRAFYGCSDLQEIVIPDGTKTVDELAFAKCTTLAKVSFPDSLQELGLQVFMDCSNLTAVKLPDALTCLPASSFANCCNLRTVELGNSLCKVGPQAFRNCVSLKTVVGNTKDVTIGDGNQYFKSLLK